MSAIPEATAGRVRRRTLVRLAGQLATPLELGEDLVVLAPHPDDETLGCGGTIHKARLAGARVTIVFLTDGSRSDSGLAEPAELRRLRRAEGIAAARQLGVIEDDLRFFDHADGRLSDSVSAATQQLSDLLAEQRPGALLAPCAWDGPADHVAAAQIAARAGAAAGLPVHGYAIWFWNRWPWTPTGRNFAPRPLWRAGRETWRLLSRFRTKVYVGDVIDVKRRALAEHRTQVERRDGDPNWSVLGDAAGGGWLELILGEERELFATVRGDAGR